MKTLLAAAALLSSPLAAAPLAQPASPAPSIAAPHDIDYPGTIALAVDATDTDHHIVRVRETIPVAGAGDLVLRYPQWLPGEHKPGGQVDRLAGLTVTANGTTLPWRRDPVDVFAFHLDVPAGVTAVEARFDYLSSTDGRQGRIEITPVMADLPWTSFALYPAGYFVRRIPVAASLTVPAGWQIGTALETATVSGATTTFKTVPFDVLMDSPVYAGKYFRRVELSASPVPVHLDLVADRPELLRASEPQLAAHRELVRQAYALYGAHHYDHYDFLLSLSAHVGGQGLEHHRSSENGTAVGYFTEWDKSAPERDLLPHEFTHSWNGKFRRGADLWTPDYAAPMRDSLLWVYEGQTQYWGYMLSARSGLLTPAQAKDAIAVIAAGQDARAGRDWKPLIDTTNDPITAARRAEPWTSWQRSEDYYNEGLLIWLDADTLIRERTKGRRSLDDFARGFFGIDNGSFTEATYTFDDVVAALNAVEPYDWASFLHARLDRVGGGAPLDGLTRGGYRLVFTDKPNDFAAAAEELGKRADFTYSLGLALDKEGALTSVLWNGPAFKAGLAAGTQLVAVGGEAFTPELLKDAITTAKASGAPVALLVKANDQFRTVTIDYRGGLRYPHLEATGGMTRLDSILAARR